MQEDYTTLASLQNFFLPLESALYLSITKERGEWYFQGIFTFLMALKGSEEKVLISL